MRHIHRAPPTAFQFAYSATSRFQPRKSATCAPRRHVVTTSAATATNEGTRINKCFKGFASRRESDDLIATQRVTINDEIAAPGARVFPGDVVCLDGEMVDWQRLNLELDTDSFAYMKHWKDVGVVCTTDASIANNIVSRVDVQVADRVFPVGRLDEASTGVILLTSDGRLPNAVLGATKGCSKEYSVVPDMYVSDEDIEKMRKGVEITTSTRRDRGVRRTITSATLPCSVERAEGFRLLITLQEGRNRQIRKMLSALGYTTRELHRVSFMGITLQGLSEAGDTATLDEREMRLIKEKLQSATA